MAKLSQLKASIVVDGAELTEITDEDIEDQDQQTPTVTRYIEVKGNAEFGINIRVTAGYPLGQADGLQFHFILDGKERDCIIFTKDDELSRGSFEKTYFAALKGEGGIWSSQKYRFSRLQVGEVAVSNRDVPPSLDRLGSITVEVRRWRRSLGRGKRENFAARLRHNAEPSVNSIVQHGLPEEAHPTEHIPEKALKGRAIDLATTLGEKTMCAAPQVVQGFSMDETPVSVFNFNYRSREALKQMLLVPRTPTPEPLEERPVESLTEAEKTELILRMRREAEATKLKLKHEKQEGNTELLPRAKHPRSDDEDEELVQISRTRAVKRRRPDRESTIIELND